MLNNDHPTPINQGQAYETMHESIVDYTDEWDHEFPMPDHDLLPYWDNYEFKDVYYGRK